MSTNRVYINMGASFETASWSFKNRIITDLRLSADQKGEGKTPDLTLGLCRSLYATQSDLGMWGKAVKTLRYRVTWGQFHLQRKVGNSSENGAILVMTTSSIHTAAAASCQRVRAVLWPHEESIDKRNRTTAVINRSIHGPHELLRLTGGCSCWHRNTRTVFQKSFVFIGF